MATKIEVREGDTLTIEVRVSRVSDDGDRVTITVVGQPFTASLDYLDIVKRDKGANWPG